MTIAIDGIIGLEVTAADIRAQFAEASEPVEMIVNSPGGLVSEGTAIFNAVRDFRRQGGEVNARVVGMAASMSSYIPLAADRITVEDNAVYMIHNPRAIAIGDQRNMRKTADTLDGLAGILANAYARKSGKPVDEVRAMMDEETYFFGQEIVDAGFADDIEPAGDGEDDRAAAVALAETHVSHMENRVKTESTETADEIAAVLGDIKGAAESRAQSGTRFKAGNQREVPMSEERKNETPAENAPSYDDGVRAGIEQERARHQRLYKAMEADPQNVKLEEVVRAAIDSGETYEDVADKVAVAIRDGGKLDGENPPQVGTADEERRQLSAEEKALADALGISYEDMLRQKGDE